VTLLILKLISTVFRLRLAQQEEDTGLDLSQHSETGYSFYDRA